MSPRVRVGSIVALAALAAAAAVTGVTLATRQDPPQPRARKGKPPLVVDRPSAVAAEIRVAFRAWPDHSLETMERLGKAYPRNPMVQLNLGLARLWAGYDDDAQSALAAAKRAGRDSVWEIRADSLLHPQYFPGYPPFQPTRRNRLLERGARIQAQGRQHSAERLFAEAARRDPGDDEAQVAAAVGRFDKGNITAAFSRLGPLTRRFPRSQSVRFHLGLLLAWTGQRDLALRQFRRTVALGAKTPLGREANAFLSRLGNRGTVVRKK